MFLQENSQRAYTEVTESVWTVEPWCHGKVDAVSRGTSLLWTLWLALKRQRRQ